MKGVPVSGQDGDHAALNRVALGTQTVSVWKDARALGREAAAAAVALAAGKKVEARSPGPMARRGSHAVEVPEARAITRDNLDVVIKAGWITKEETCKGVAKEVRPRPASSPAAVVLFLNSVLAGPRSRVCRA